MSTEIGILVSSAIISFALFWIGINWKLLNRQWEIIFRVIFIFLGLFIAALTITTGHALLLGSPSDFNPYITVTSANAAPGTDRIYVTFYNQTSNNLMLAISNNSGNTWAFSNITAAQNGTIPASVLKLQETSVRNITWIIYATVAFMIAFFLVEFLLWFKDFMIESQKLKTVKRVV